MYDKFDKHFELCYLFDIVWGFFLVKEEPSVHNCDIDGSLNQQTEMSIFTKAPPSLYDLYPAVGIPST